jgi:hypothetical protein
MGRFSSPDFFKPSAAARAKARAQGIRAVDAAQRAKRIDRRDESAKVLLHEPRFSFSVM